MIRRDMLKYLAALASLPLPALAEEPGITLGPSSAFSPDDVVERARALAAEPFRPRATVPQDWQDLTYDEYRMIWFDSRNALWEGSETPHRVDVFPPGLYFPRPVAINVVENGETRPFRFNMAVFDTTDQFPEVSLDDTLGYSGLRLRAELEARGRFQEYAVFQGASYFRGIGAGNIYGLSARGLALKTGDPMGEEFPDFKAFWLETPAIESSAIVVHALLDSPSCTGAYRFEISPGPVLTMEVSATIFARDDLDHIGIAPLTSMFLFDGTMRDRFSDFRPAVHDSDGLAIRNGAGEMIWRPLHNPRGLQVSAFADDGPQGFGLCQRKRTFSDFNDLEALYHLRPSVWITPGESWGKGAVTLVEIPADLEIYDNIVAYWRPDDPILARSEHFMSYSLDWGADVEPPSLGLLKVLRTAMGERPEGDFIVTIDLSPEETPIPDLDRIEITLRSSAGEVTPGLVQRNPDTGGPRLAFTFQPKDAQLSEFRAQLRLDGAPLSEVWLYRWTAA